MNDGDKMLHIRGPDADIHEFLASPTDTVRELLERLSGLVDTPAACLSLRHGHFIFEDAGLDKQIKDLKLEGPGPISLNYTVKDEGYDYIKASASKAEWYWRDQGLHRRVMKIGLENFVLPEVAKSVVVVWCYFRGVFEGGVEADVREPEKDDSYASQQVWKKEETGRVYIQVCGNEAPDVALDTGSKRKVEGPCKIWEVNQRQFRQGDLIELWIDAPATEKLSKLEHQCSLHLEYHWSIHENLYDGPPVRFGDGQSRVQVRSPNGFRVHFTDSNGEVCRSVDVAPDQAFLCCRQATACEVDQKQGKVVLMGGFHNAQGEVAGAGVVVQAPIGTDIGQPPAGGGIRLEAVPSDPVLEEQFEIDLDASAALFPKWGHLCVEEGYGLDKNRQRSCTVAQVPKWAAVTCTLHRGRMAQPGSALAVQGADAKSPQPDPTMRIHEARDRVAYRLHHVLTPRLGTFEPEITVMGQCLRRPPEDLTGTFLRVSSIPAQEIPYFMICGESRLKVTCEVACDMYFHNYSFDAGLTKGHTKAMEVAAGETLTCNRYAMGYYLAERPWCLVLTGGFADAGHPLATASYPHIAYKSAPSVTVGGNDCGVPNNGGCVVMRPRQARKLVGTMKFKEKQHPFTCSGSVRSFLSSTWPFRIHFCTDADISTSTRHVDVAAQSVVEVCHLSSGKHQISELGRVVSFIGGFVANDASSEDEPCIQLHAEGGDVKDLGLPEPEGSVAFELLYDPCAHIKQKCFTEVIEPLRGPESTWSKDREITVQHYDTFDETIAAKCPPYPFGIRS